MLRSEQNRLIDDLRGLTFRMKSTDREEFASLESRNKDDEDLDEASAARLRKLHAAYKPPKSREELEQLWNNLASKTPRSSKNP